MIREARYFRLSRGEHERVTPSFVSVHGTDSQGRFGGEIDAFVVRSTLSKAYLANLTGGKGSYGYRELAEDFNPWAQNAEKQHRTKSRLGRFTLITAVHDGAAVTHVRAIASRDPEPEPVGAGSIDQADAAFITDFAVRPEVVGFGIGSTLLHQALNEYPAAAGVNFEVLGTAGNPMETWLQERLGFELGSDDYVRKLGLAGVSARLYVANSVGEVRAALEETGKFSPVETVAA